MDSDKILAQLRQFLLVISACVFIMTVTELFFLEHWNVTIQFLPFALSALGLIGAGLAYFRPSRGVILFTQWAMIIIAICSAIGFYQHMTVNLAFWLEIQPDATTWELVEATFRGGVPVLAPGILTLGGVIGATATYKHPALETK
jgi:hypothetical protein